MRHTHTKTITIMGLALLLTATLIVGIAITLTSLNPPRHTTTPSAPPPDPQRWTTEISALGFTPSPGHTYTDMYRAAQATLCGMATHQISSLVADGLPGTESEQTIHANGYTNEQAATRYAQITHTYLCR